MKKVTENRENATETAEVKPKRTRKVAITETPAAEIAPIPTAEPKKKGKKIAIVGSGVKEIAEKIAETNPEYTPIEPIEIEYREQPQAEEPKAITLMIAGYLALLGFALFHESKALFSLSTSPANQGITYGHSRSHSSKRHVSPSKMKRRTQKQKQQKRSRINSRPNEKK